ncbi:MAG: 2OG-Fe(II) oxygenase [Byssovorax sp.]
MAEDIADVLMTLQTGGAFAVELTMEANALSLDVAEVGPIRLPVSAATARKLCAVARPAPYGLRDKTLLDRNVRDAWEIGPKQARLDTKVWPWALGAKLPVIRERLGLPAEGSLEVRFDKLLVYGPGQFFAPHQDSERDDAMIGTLVVELPSAHEGGALIVEHRGKSHTFPSLPRKPKELGLYAFYADCRHEVKPVESGFRVALSYHLLFRAPKAKKAQTLPSSATDRLEAAVNAHFSTPIKPLYSTAPAAPPKRLVYLLDHEYTQKGLSWDHLKNGDGPRSLALREVARKLDCEVFLALAEVHECWNCEDDDYGYRRRRGRYSSYDEEERDAGDYALIDLISSEVELTHWVDDDGTTSAGASLGVSEDEICWTRESSEMDPFKSEHEGYMGNYGNTLDRWYHRAALVMWPKSQSFALRAEASPAWAVHEIASSIKRGALDEARARAKALRSCWDWGARSAMGARDVAALLGVLAALDDADLASSLLAPLGLERLTPAALPRFVALVDRFGFPWSENLLSKWYGRTLYDDEETWKSLPRIVTAFHGAGGAGEALIRWLFEREVEAFRQNVADWRSVEARYAKEGEGDVVGHALALLDGAVSANASAVRDELIAFMTNGQTRLPWSIAAALLRKSRTGRDAAAVAALGLAPLVDHLVKEIEAALAEPERSLSDWSIAPPGDCKCALCKELGSFLRDGTKIRHVWPLAKDNRQHIHRVIDGADLPVTHETLREGRPQSLVLTKQNTLFSRARALRDEQKKLLAWLIAERAAFTGAPPVKKRARRAPSR